MKSPKRERRERLFMPRPVAQPAVVYGLGALGAAALGAGSWAQWGRIVFGSATEPLPFGWWVLAGGAVIEGLAIWFGTSGEPLLHVGDGGVALEKSGFLGTLPPRRVAWHQVESVEYQGDVAGIVVRGRDESGADLLIVARLASHPQAAAWIVQEARERVPDVVRVGDEIELPAARPEAGEILSLDAVQVVGKKCAASGTILAFESDARVCPRCERVYHKDHVPDACACGASLAAPREEKPLEPSPEAPQPSQEA